MKNFDITFKAISKKFNVFESKNRHVNVDVDLSEEHKKYVKKICLEIQENILGKNKNLQDLLDRAKISNHKEKTEVFKLYVGSVDGIKCYLVNGNEVKTKKFMDFTEGGNGMVYGKKSDKVHPDFVPYNEAWVDADIDESQFPYILLHEIVEYVLMKNKNFSYDKAHRKANGAEKYMRHKNFFNV